MILSGSPTYDQSSKLIESINKILETQWSHSQVTEGKKIEVPLEWGYDVYCFTAKRYQREGWLVTRSVELTSSKRHYYLEFKHPKWKQYSDQFTEQ
jgi:hypothetical protein